MTAQIPDKVNYLGDNFSLINHSGTGLFDPCEHGMHPIAGCTALWRGFIAHYAIEEKNFLIKSVQISHAALNHYPQICGVSAKDGLYKLNHKMPFTGFLRIARGFIQKYYRHMAFQPAEGYKVVFDVAIRYGDVFSIKDVSKDMEKARDRSQQKDAGPVPEERIPFCVPSDVNHWWNEMIWAREIEDWPAKRPALNRLVEEFLSTLTDGDKGVFLKVPQISARFVLEETVLKRWVHKLTKNSFEKLVLELLEDGNGEPVDKIPQRYWNPKLLARAIVDEVARRVRRESRCLSC